MASYSRIEDVPLFRYGLVMADPAWDHAFYSEKGSERAPSNHYDTMTKEEIKALPVGQLCGAHAYVMLWVPGCFIDLGLEVLGDWGFKFVTMGFWVKNQKKDPAQPAMGCGYVLRECGEPFLIGRIGRPEIRDRGIPSVIMEPRRKEHSRKPEAGYRLAERLTPPGAFRLDLFSRQTRPGWDNMGNEAKKFDAAAE